MKSIIWKCEEFEGNYAKLPQIKDTFNPISPQIKKLNTLESQNLLDLPKDGFRQSYSKP